MVNMADLYDPKSIIKRKSFLDKIMVLKEGDTI